MDFNQIFFTIIIQGLQGACVMLWEIVKACPLFGILFCFIITDTQKDKIQISLLHTKPSFLVRIGGFASLLFFNLNLTTFIG